VRVNEEQDRFERALLKLEIEKSTELAGYAQETERLKAEYEKESEQLRLEFLDQARLRLLEDELRLKETNIAQFEADLLQTQLEHELKKQALSKLKEDLQSEPRYLVLSKAITDEALWQRLGTADEELPADLESLRLRSELLNPTYQTLVQQMIQAQQEFTTVSLKLKYLPTEIQSARQQVDQLRRLITKRQIELSNLSKDRSSQLNRLLEQRSSELEILSKRLTGEIALLKRQRDLKLGGIQRELEAASASYGALAEEHRSAQLTRLEGDPDVKIGARAVVPREPVGTLRWLRIATGLIFGLLGSLVLAAVWAYVESIQPL
jgi:uncharacterized protein involved in exopolysaccharide biosynthesis